MSPFVGPECLGDNMDSSKNVRCEFHIHADCHSDTDDQRWIVFLVRRQQQRIHGHLHHQRCADIQLHRRRKSELIAFVWYYVCRA